MKYIIACLLLLGFLAKAGATEIIRTGDSPAKCGLRSQQQKERPREYRIRSLQNNRRNYKSYDNAREAKTVSNDYYYNQGFSDNGY